MTKWGFKVTYYYKKHEWTAFTEADLLSSGSNLGSSINYGDTFTMPGSASVTMSTYDNDGSLSGDGYYDDHAADSSGQLATVDGHRVGSQMYAEQYWVLHGSDGKTYYMIEIEVECHDAPGAGDDYFTFYGDVPPAGVSLTVGNCCNVSGSWVDYSCLGAGSDAPVNTPPTFTNVPSDGIICIDENTTFVIDLNSSDADGDSVTYEIVGGADAHLFEIDAHTGELTFKDAPDYENPQDAINQDNIYDVNVKVSDGNGGSEIKNLWVKVNDVDEGTGGQTCMVIEAEDMHLSGFSVKHASSASGGEYAGAYSGCVGSASTTFTGADGECDITITAWDAKSKSWYSSASEKVWLYVNGQCVGSYNLTNDDCDWTDVTFENVSLQTGDTITIYAKGVNGTIGAIDKITICCDMVDPMTGKLGNKVFLDLNGNGIQDAGEAGVAGVTVNLLDADGNIIDTTTTDADGMYLFDGLAAGDYSVSFVPTGDGAGLLFTDANQGGDDAADSDADAAGNTGTITLGMGEENLTVDAGLVDPGTASISGRIFMDNNDNDQDDNEMGVGGVTVTLLDSDGNVVATTTTAADGSYTFSDLDAGDYVVDFPTEVDGKVLVNQNVGPDATDSDADQGTGETNTISVGVGENVTDVDAGVEDPGTASLAGRVFMDNNDNDIDDAGDMGVSGVTVTLLSGGQVVATTTTDSNGDYSFTGLDAGDYVVEFPTDVDGKVLVNANQGGDDTVDSDADQGTGQTGPISIGIGDNVTDVDAGVEDPGTAAIEGKVFMDNNDNDIDDAGDMPVGGVVVELLNADGSPTGLSTTTANDGTYSFTGLAAGSYIVAFPTDVDGKTLVNANVGGDDTVDSDAGANGQTGVITVGIGETSSDNDAGVEDPGTASVGNLVFLDKNGNGVYDAGDETVSGVVVELLDETGNVVDSTVTGSNGEYLFENLDAGVYSVRFTAPTGYDFTAESGAAADDVNNDSDADLSTGETGQFALSIGEAELDIDAGLVSEDPVAGDDAGKGCADDDITVDVLANDSDLEALTVTSVNGQAISEGQTITTTSGVNVTLSGGELVFDGEQAYESLNIGEMSTESFTYTVSDGAGGEASANVDVTFCGVAETLEQLYASLPTSGSYKVRADNEDAPIGEAAYDVAISGTGDARFDGAVFTAAYCLSLLDPVDTAESFDDAPLLTGDITDGKDGSVFSANQIGFANGQAAADNLDLVNWIINQNFEADAQFTEWEVQRAIWELTDEFDTDYLSDIDPAYGDDADVDFIVQQALANGEGFMAGQGDLASLIIDPNPATSTNSQPFIVAFSFDDNDCLC